MNVSRSLQPVITLLYPVCMLIGIPLFVPAALFTSIATWIRAVIIIRRKYALAIYTAIFTFIYYFFLNHRVAFISYFKIFPDLDINISIFAVSCSCFNFKVFTVSVICTAAISTNFRTVFYQSINCRIVHTIVNYVSSIDIIIFAEKSAVIIIITTVGIIITIVIIIVVIIIIIVIVIIGVFIIYESQSTAYSCFWNATKSGI